jgi:hypothetical protein
MRWKHIERAAWERRLDDDLRVPAGVAALAFQIGCEGEPAEL